MKCDATNLSLPLHLHPPILNPKATAIAHPVAAYFCYSGGSGSDDENDVTEQEQDRRQITKQGEEMSEDDDDDDNNDEDDDNNNDDNDEHEVATSVSALTVGDLIEAMKTKKKAAAPSQPSSVVSDD